MNTTTVHQKECFTHAKLCELWAMNTISNSAPIDKFTQPLRPEHIRDFACIPHVPAQDTYAEMINRQPTELDSAAQSIWNSTHPTLTATLLDSTTLLTCMNTVINIGDTLSTQKPHSDTHTAITIELTNMGSQQNQPTRTDGLADLGANVQMTNDPTILIGIHDIDPLIIGLADAGHTNTCTQCGYLPILREDNEWLMVPILINPHANGTILSPQCIMMASTDITGFTIQGYRNASNNTLTFHNKQNTTIVMMKLRCIRDLYYIDIPSLHTSKPPHTINMTVHHPISINRLSNDTRQQQEKDAIDIEEWLKDGDILATPVPNHSPPTTEPARLPTPVTPQQLLTSEVWMARLGHCEPRQLHLLQRRAKGLPQKLLTHPFRFIDHKIQANIHKQPAQKSTPPASAPGQQFYMDYAFFRASTSNYSKPDTKTDRIIQSIDGFNGHLLIKDSFTKKAWVFLCTSKEPPLAEIRAFLKFYGGGSGIIRCDQGGELARSTAFRTLVLAEFNYVVEPTGADSPSQNGAVERYNRTMGAMVRCLLYGAGLPAEFWSYALVHAVYIYNRLVHSRTKRTPFEAWHGFQPDISHLHVFGSRVCVKQSGSRRAKLDKHHFTGIFLGYTATDQNIIYLDLQSNRVKFCHHAYFDEAWYSQPARPPTAQLLYDCGMNHTVEYKTTPQTTQPPLRYPPRTHSRPPTLPNQAVQQPLPLHQLACTTYTSQHPTRDPYANTSLAYNNKDRKTVNEYDITTRDMAQVYIAPCPYYHGTEIELDLGPLNRRTHFESPTAGMKFITSNGRMLLQHIDQKSLAARIPRWRSTIKGAWLRSINDNTVTDINDVKKYINQALQADSKTCTLVFSHPEIAHGLTNDGIPQINHDQLNPRHRLRQTLDNISPPDIPITRQRGMLKEEGGVQNFTSNAVKLTRGKLLQDTTTWPEWQKAEYAQLDQYHEQGMFGEPTRMNDTSTVFNLVWTYAIKTLDQRKKARCTCDGSTRGGQVRILDHTYANCVDQTSSRIFYAASAVEDHLIFGADVSNAFGEAPPPKQGFHIRPDRAFREWYKHKYNRDIPPNHVIPIHAAMQGHPESPRLWERHADSILRKLGLTPTTHEPCIYSGIINNKRILFLRQVDDFAIAAPDEHTANILFDMIDEELTFPLKRMGLIDLFNGINVEQTKDYIHISCSTYLDKIMERHTTSWLDVNNRGTHATPLSTKKTFLDKFYNTNGDPNPDVQAKLAKSNTFQYRSGVGELIYALTTCRPDISYATVRAAQFSTAPAQIHYDGIKMILAYLHNTKNDGITFWRTKTNDNPLLKQTTPPHIHSNPVDLLMDERPEHDPLDIHAYADADWAGDTRSRRSFTGCCVRMAGGTIAYKTKLQPTVAQSSTEAEFMGACDTGKMLLFIRSILWDLGIPQTAASILYEDNDACIAMANAQKPTIRTRHMDIKYHAICEWVERDYMVLERVHTSRNLADHFTKQLNPILFKRHTDYIMGRVPPKYAPWHKIVFGTNTPTTNNDLPTPQHKINLVHTLKTTWWQAITGATC